MSDQSHANVLMDAKAAIIEHGWITGALGNTEKGFCIAGALAHVLGGNTLVMLDTDKLSKFRNVVRKLANLVGQTTISGWNDHPGRTQQEVLDLFDTAIAAENRT